MITRCALCPGTNTCIGPDGPDDAELLFIGEAPGKDENRKGVVFIGKTGEEVNRHYLPLAGLSRAGVRFANAIRCLPTTGGGKLDPNRAKDIALLQSCSSTFLDTEILRGRYRVLVPMGAFAVKAICPEVSLDLGHGIPVETRWGIPAFPMYHPALGIHSPKRMLQIRTDWQRLRQFLKGTLRLPMDVHSAPDYREITDASQITLDPKSPLACDTESRRGNTPYCLTYSQHPGHGRLIRAERRDLLLQFQGYLERWQAPLLWHNWLYDWPVVTTMGLTFPHRKVVDTMAAVYQLGNLPQGLKALAFRELGMEMQDFDDLVAPYSTDRVLHYFERARTVDWPKPDADLIIDDKTGLWKTYKPQGLNTKLKRLFTDLSKNPNKDLFGTWENWEAEQPLLESELGPYPGKCISHVPFDKMLFYACRDADALIRLWPLLKRMQSRVRHVSQEHWAA